MIKKLRGLYPYCPCCDMGSMRSSTQLHMLQKKAERFTGEGDKIIVLAIYAHA